jgi:hypothetical protein
MARVACHRGLSRLLLRLPHAALNVIDKPFKVGSERTDDDVSLFLLTEFVVHAQVGGAAAEVAVDVAAQAEALEEQFTEVEEAQPAEAGEALTAAMEELKTPVDASAPQPKGPQLTGPDDDENQLPGPMR